MKYSPNYYLGNELARFFFIKEVRKLISEQVSEDTWSNEEESNPYEGQGTP